MNRPEYQSVGKSVRKKDAMQQLLGKPLYTEDIVHDALVVKLLRSPHANAIVETIDTSKAKKVAGVMLVARQKQTHYDELQKAAESIRNLHSSVLRGVITDVSETNKPYAMYKSYKYKSYDYEYKKV